MLPNQYEVEWMIEERMREALREAERTRLIRAVNGPGKPGRWRLATSALKGILAALIPISISRHRRTSQCRYVSGQMGYDKPCGHAIECR